MKVQKQIQKRKMKILFYNHTGKVSGAERVILLVLKRLNKSRYVPLMVCPKSDTMAEETAKLGVPCRTINQLEARFTVRPDKLARYFFSFARTFRQLRAEIIKAQPDLIHANSIRAGLASSAASVGTKIPVIWHLQDELKPHPLSTLIRLFVACSARIRLMPVSQATGDKFRGKFLKFFEERMPEQIVHNAVELEEFQFDAANRSRIRKELNLSDGEFVLGIIGQITPRKGQIELLRTFAKTQKQIPSSTLLVVGAPMFNQDHLYLEELKQTARDLEIEDRVRFLGSRRDITAIMQSLDLLVINSKSEALVLVAIEAMACRTPIIATDVGGTREIIEHKTNGWLVPLGDEKALIDGVAALREQPELRRQFAAESEKIVASRLNAEYFISRVEEFYEQCAAREERAVNKDLAIQN